MHGCWTGGEVGGSNLEASDKKEAEEETGGGAAHLLRTGRRTLLLHIQCLGNFGLGEGGSRGLSGGQGELVRAAEA